MGNLMMTKLSSSGRGWTAFTVGLPGIVALQDDVGFVVPASVIIAYICSDLLDKICTRKVE